MLQSWESQHETSMSQLYIVLVLIFRDFEILLEPLIEYVKCKELRILKE